MKSPYQICTALQEIAVAQANSGDRDSASKTFAKAIKCAQSEITDDYGRDSAVLWIAEAKVGAKMSKEAFESIKRISEDKERAQAMRFVGSAQAKMGDTKAALETAQAIADKSVKGIALEEIALVQLEAGDAPGAWKTVQGIEDNLSLQKAMQHLARAMVGKRVVKMWIADRRKNRYNQVTLKVPYDRG